MDIDELRTKQAEFEGNRQEFRKEAKKLEKRRGEFVNSFSEDKLKNLKIDEFVVGKGSENTFCYLLETGLVGLGNIHGATAFKFGVYYGITKSDSVEKYRFTARFGNNELEAFQNVKSAIISLLHSARNNRLNEIKDNQLSPMFKGKILATYFPDRFLNIFAENFLNYYLDKLDIPYLDSQDEIDKRELLMRFKNNDSVMKNWSIYEFSKFLYEKIGRPLKDGENVPEELKAYIEPEFPPLNRTHTEFVDLVVIEIDDSGGTSSTRGKKRDFERENKRNIELGKRGEILVLDKEKEYLRSIGGEELASKVKHVSQEDDSAGYDILSFDNTGNPRYIEVKALRQKATSANFMITSNELDKAKKLENYYVYLIFEADTIHPKIGKLKKPFGLPQNKIRITPASYRVRINFSKI